MSTRPGSFVWYELMTTDTAAAEAFYAGVIGWQVQDAGMPGYRYVILSVGDTSIGGLMGLPPEPAANGARPAWVGYLAVPDVDDYAVRVAQAGGSVHRPPDDIPGVGRFAVVADPQGASFVLFKGSSPEAPVPAPAGTPGHVGWRELMSGDWQAAFAFYAGLFGWTKDQAVDIGPMGTYQLFANGGAAVGGMMTQPAEGPPAAWQYYFNVDDIHAAAARITAHGGQVVNGPMEVPGGDWVVNALDPQGAVFGVVGPNQR